jgi:hypothetical protein
LSSVWNSAAHRAPRQPKENRMSTTYLVTLANTNDGTVHGHKAGCADLKRGAAYRNHKDEQFEIEVSTKREAWLDYNADFIAEGGEENAWPVEWLPCADHVPADAAAPVEPAAPKKATKADQIAILLERGTHARPALQKMTLAALTALVDQAPAPAAVEEPAKTKAKRTKNAVVQVDGHTVRLGAMTTVHDAEGKRVAIVRRDAVPALTTAVAEKVMRVQTAYLVDEKSIGWVRNGTSLASVAKIITKAQKAAGK